MTRFAPALLVTMTLLAALPAFAAGITPTVSRVPSITGIASQASHPSFSGGVGGGTTISNADGVTMQTNIDASHSVQAGSNVSVNETVNGVSVGHGGMGGGDFLAGANADGQAAWADKQAYYQQLQNEASMMVQVWQGSGYGY